MSFTFSLFRVSSRYKERSDFLAKMRADKKKFLKKKNEEYLEIARMAGITDQSGDGIDPMGIFVAEDEVDFNDDIDVRVQWDGQTEERRRVNMPDEYEEDIDVQ